MSATSLLPRPSARTHRTFRHCPACYCDPGVRRFPHCNMCGYPIPATETRCDPCARWVAGDRPSMDLRDHYLELLAAIVTRAATDAAGVSLSGPCTCGRSAVLCGRRYVLAVQRDAIDSKDPRDAFLGMVAA